MASTGCVTTVPAGSITTGGSVGGGTGSSPKGSGIIKEYFEYSSSPTANPSYVDITETPCISFDLSARPDTLANITARPNGSDYYLHYGVQDKALNSSDTVRFDFKIDNDDPYIIRKNNTGGCTTIAQDYLYVIQEVTDDTSGVVYYTHEASSIGTVNKVTLSTNYVNPSKYEIYQNVSIGSTAGPLTVKVISYDQAENCVVNQFGVTRSSQTINWIQLYGSRSPDSPFLVKGYYKAEITPTAPDLISGFYPTANLYYSPVTTDFDTTVGSQSVSEQDFLMIVADSNVSRGMMYLKTDGTPHACASKDFTFAALDYNTISATPPIISIEEKLLRTCTNSQTNQYTVKGDGGDITISGSFTSNGDLIIGYMLTESASSPGPPPTFNPVTNNFEDSMNTGWTVYSKGTTTFNRLESYTFSSATFEIKTLYLWVATMAYSGKYPNFSTGQVFSTSVQIEYVNDFVGPTATNISVTDASGVTEMTTVQSGTDPNQTFVRATKVEDDTVLIEGTLTDNMTSVNCTCVKRWVVGNFGSPPPYTHTQPGVWNVVTNHSQSINFSQSVTLNRPNSTKTVYLYAVDCIGNMSVNKIRITLDNPAYQIPTYGVQDGQVYKFEGKPAEHPLRKTIASMFGNGVFHSGHFISNKTPLVRLNRIHKLREYRGLRVINRKNNDAYENLPEVDDPLKFSDFYGKIPRIDDLTIHPFIPPITTPVGSNIPLYVNDVRDFALTMDIDTGNVATEYKLPFNDNLVDDAATWFVDFIEEGTALVSQKAFNYNPTTGHINGFVFDKAGVYFFIAFCSFGLSVSATYRIYEQGAPIPPVQDPPVDVEVPIGNAGGTTPVTVPFYVDQVSLAIDAAFCIDRSGSYVPGFSNAMYATLSQSLDALANFSRNTETNTTNARYSVVWFWNPASSGGIETKQNWTFDRTKIVDAVSAYKNNARGGSEPKIEAVAKIANSTLVGPWRENALRLILLYSDEPDGSPTNLSTGSSSSIYTTASSPTYYTNLLIDNQIAFVLFDAGKNYGTVPEQATINQDGLLNAIAATSQNGSVVQTLGLGASPNDIVAAIDTVFTKYKDGLTFDIEPDLSTPAIFKSKTANAAHPAGTTVPIPYNSLINDGTRKKALFDVELDNDEVYSLGTDYIITYVTIYNSSNVPIARKMIRIHVTA